MTMLKSTRIRLKLAGLAASISVAMSLPVSAAPEIVTAVANLSHIHGIEFDRSDAQAVFLATHSGLYRVQLDERLARLTSEDRNDYMGFAVRPDTGAILVSGHPETGGNMGIISSHNGGKTWVPVSEGADGPVDFHAIAISETTPSTAYGLYQGGVQVSSDDGRSWAWTGSAPANTFDLAATGSALLAATTEGMMLSADKGLTWSEFPGDLDVPASMVKVSGDSVFAYFVGRGLVHRALTEDTWTLASNAFGDDYLLHLAVAGDSDLLAAVTQSSRVLISKDRGASWSVLE
ncbi:MAG: hypothetical protein KKF33_15100 [Alphaproteobacteria bacterium]|nr:hypothetical protein [Alphaproteobacteria bacterium]